MPFAFTPPALPRGPQRRRAAHDRRRHPERNRARLRLEGLEDRRLLSITELPVPTAQATPFGITTGPDGNLWFTEAVSSTIGAFNPTTHLDTEISTYGYATTAITAGPDGNLWFTSGNGGLVGSVNPATQYVSLYSVPILSGRPSSGPEGIAAGPDGNLWFADGGNDAIGRIDPATGAITLFPVPTANAVPLAITTGPDGNLWFTERDANKIGEINPTTHAVNEFPIPTAGSGPEGIAAGPDGNLWFTEFNAGRIATINPVTHAIVERVVPYAGSGPEGIAAGPDGNIWFTDQNNDAIGVDYLRTAHLAVTQQPPAGVAAGSPFGLTVRAEDGSGNPLSSFNGTVTVALASNPGGATLAGPLTATASGGVATFSGLTLTRAASGYSFEVTAGGLGPAVTGAMTVTPASATRLVITQQPPATVKVSSPFAMRASIEDAYGNLVTTASGTVAVALANNPTGATLGGTLSVTASQGVASFTGLTINKVGSGYTLRVFRSGLTSATSNPINVTKNGMAAGALSTPVGSPATALPLAPPVLDSPDLWDGLRLKKRSRLV